MIPIKHTHLWVLFDLLRDAPCWKGLGIVLPKRQGRDMLSRHNMVWAWCDTAPPIWGYRSPLAAQSKFGYINHTQCASMSQCEWHGDDGTSRVGTLDPLLVGLSPTPSWTPDPMGTPWRPTSMHTCIQAQYGNLFFQQQLTYKAMDGSGQCRWDRLRQRQWSGKGACCLRWLQTNNAEDVMKHNCLYIVIQMLLTLVFKKSKQTDSWESIFAKTLIIIIVVFVC